MSIQSVDGSFAKRSGSKAARAQQLAVATAELKALQALPMRARAVGKEQAHALDQTLRPWDASVRNPGLLRLTRDIAIGTDFMTGEYPRYRGGLSKKQLAVVDTVAPIAAAADAFMQWQHALLGDTDRQHHGPATYSARDKDGPSYDLDATFIVDRKLLEQDAAFHPRELPARLAIALAPLGISLDALPALLRGIRPAGYPNKLDEAAASIAGFATDPRWQQLKEWVPIHEVIFERYGLVEHRQLQADTVDDHYARMNRMVFVTAGTAAALPPPPAPAAAQALGGSLLDARIAAKLPPALNDGAWLGQYVGTLDATREIFGQGAIAQIIPIVEQLNAHFSARMGRPVVIDIKSEVTRLERGRSSGEPLRGEVFAVTVDGDRAGEQSFSAGNCTARAIAANLGDIARKTLALRVQ